MDFAFDFQAYVPSNTLYFFWFYSTKTYKTVIWPFEKRIPLFLALFVG